MSQRAIVSDAFFLAGDRLERLRDVLRIAVHQARVTQNAGYGRHVEHALVEVEDTLTDLLAKMDNAMDDDQAEAEETGEAERERRSCFPRYRAA
jgi:hypothetical protein